MGAGDRAFRRHPRPPSGGACCAVDRTSVLGSGLAQWLVRRCVDRRPPQLRAGIRVVRAVPAPRAGRGFASMYDLQTLRRTAQYFHLFRRIARRNGWASPPAARTLTPTRAVPPRTHSTVRPNSSPWQESRKRHRQFFRGLTTKPLISACPRISRLDSRVFSAPFSEALTGGALRRAGASARSLGDFAYPDRHRAGRLRAGANCGCCACGVTDGTAIARSSRRSPIAIRPHRLRFASWGDHIQICAQSGLR